MAARDRLRVGILGQGGMGTCHAVNITRFVGDARVVAVYDPDAERAAAGTERCPGARAFDDPAALIADPGVDAVVIASPDPTHVPFMLEALRCAKPVLCEKPMALDLAEAERVIAAETAGGRRLLSLAFMRRFDPQHQAVHALVASGAIGRPVLYRGIHRNAARGHRFDPHGVILNSASHDLDAACWLTGRDVTAIYARALRTRDEFTPESRDLVLLQADLGDDCLLTVEVFIAADYGYEVSAEIVGQRGSALTAQPEPALLRARGARSVGVDGDWLVRFQPAYLAEVVDWVAAVQAGTVWSGGSAWDGYLALLAGTAACESLRTGRPEPVPAVDRPALYAR